MKSIPAAVVLVCLLASLQVKGQELVSVEPGQGEAGTTLEITVTGEPGIFYFEYSFLTFEPAGDLITHDAFVPVDANVFRTNISIAAATPSGMQDVRLHSEEYVYLGTGLFEVAGGSGPDPQILSVNPAWGVAGTGLTVTITGENTNFTSGSVVTFSSGGIQVGTLTRRSPTVLEAQISLASDASLGSRNVTVTTGTEVASGQGLFSVVEPPVILEPDSGMQGTSIATLTITGGPGGYSAQTGVDLGDGITVGTLAGSGQTLTLTDVSIATDAPVGNHDLTLTNPPFAGASVFVVEQGPDTQLLSVTPDHGDRGHPYLTVNLTGQNTHFDVPGLTIRFSGLDLRAIDLNGIDQTSLEATLLISSEAVEGERDVTVALGADVDCGNCESTTLAGGFEITTPGALTSADPWILEAGQTVRVSISATDGQFNDAETQLWFEPPDGLEVISLTVSDSDHLTAELRVSGDAPGDVRDVFAVSATEVALGPGLVDVYHPEIRRVSPSTAFPGSSPSVTITGVDLPFDANTQVEFSGAGISVNSVTFDPEEPDEIRVAITIAPDAPLEDHDVTVTTGIIQVVGVAMFEVVDLKEKEESGGCSCASGPLGSAYLGLGLLSLFLFRRRRIPTGS